MQSTPNFAVPTTDPDRVTLALSDLLEGVQGFRIVNLLAMNEVKHRYRRSRLGMLWITLSMAVWVATISFVFTSLFRNIDSKHFITYITISVILWGFFSSTVTEGCVSFINNDEFILAEPLPLSLFPLKVAWFSLIVMGHNLIVYALVAFALQVPLSFSTLLAIPGFALLVLNCLWLMLVLALGCTRYRDLSQIVANLLQVLFYLTPVIWTANLLPEHRRYVVTLNPLFHLFEVVRAPLLGEPISAISWALTGLLAVVGWALAIALFARFRERVAYWL